MSIVLTDFARSRLFREQRRNTIQNCTPEQFERHLDEVPPLRVFDGYAPICKLHVHGNWTPPRCLSVPITGDNLHHLCSVHDTRSRDELPVIDRWFEGLEAPVSQQLTVTPYV